MLRADAFEPPETHALSRSADIPWSRPARRKRMLGLFRALDRQLESSCCLAGDSSIEDIAHWAWVCVYAWSGIDRTSLGAPSRWVDRVARRNACLWGTAVPRRFEPAEPVYQVKSMLLPVAGGVSRPVRCARHSVRRHSATNAP